MRLTLQPAPLELVAAAAGDAGDAGGEGPARRTIAGLAVPYEVEARVGFQLVTFAAGSVTPADRVPLLLGHDPNQPVGIQTSSSDQPDGLRATYSIDQTPDGDAALTQAASGSRAGLSVGVDLEQFEQDPDNPDRIRVLRARLAETSLVALSAYPAAGVESVAASDPNQRSETVPENPTPDPAATPTAAAAATIAENQPPANPAPPAAPAAPARPALILADRPRPEMRLGEYVQTLIRAERGDRAAGERITAALDRGDVTTSPGVIPVAYVADVIDSLGASRPLFDAMDHADMPAAGMTIRRPEVTTRPDGNFLANDQAGAPTGPVAITDADVDVRQWAWAGAASVALVERSSPSYIEEVFAQAIRSYYRDVEADIAAAFPDATGGAGSIGAAVGMFANAYRDAPGLLVLGGMAYGRLLDATGLLMFASGSADVAGNATYAGLKVVASPDLPPGDGWVTARDFQEVRESSPIRLSVSNVEALQLEIGVTAFYSRQKTRQDVGAVKGAVGIPTFAPPSGQAAATRRGEK